MFLFFLNLPATPGIYTYCHTRSLHDSLPISNLTTKSLLDSIGAWVGVMRGLAGMTSQGRSPLQRYSCRLPRPLAATPRPRMRLQQQELLHVPGPGRAAFGAQAAVQAHVLVLEIGRAHV